jgi:DNA polymerase I-like protein with 3'-5' exonuclease and polymerase domains
VGPLQFQGELIKNGFFLEAAVCKKLLDTAKAKDPHLAEWKRKIRERIKSDRTLITPLGRKRTFLGRLNDNTYRAAYAFSPQSTVGELLQLALQDIYEKYSDWIEVLLNVHDEVISQVDDEPETIDAAIRAIRSSMEIPISVGGKQLVIPCEFKVGPSWGELKEVK